MALPDYLGGGKTAPAQSMPGQIDAISQQLRAGYGPGDYMSWMKNLYSAQPAAPAAPAPTTPAAKSFQDMSWHERLAQMGHGVMVGDRYVPPQIAPWMDRGKVAAMMDRASPQAAPVAPTAPKAPMTDFASIFNQARTINRGGSR